MALVVPTITAENTHQYREQVERVAGFAKHLHVDIMDGIFAPTDTFDLELLWLPEDITCDIHIMYKEPEQTFDELSKLSVRTLIVPAEVDVDFAQLANKAHKTDKLLGVALLAETTIESAKFAIENADHVLIFSGNLGYQGGSEADLELLLKVPQIKAINSNAEIGWDGGVNEQNIKQIADAGVDIINTGGFVHHSDNPSESFRKLQQQIS
jgi:ribulose-phosphate 3-epimerase